MNELKPCPFCGGRAEMRALKMGFYGGKIYWVHCISCCAEINNPKPVEEDAIKDWNRRVRKWKLT